MLYNVLIELERDALFDRDENVYMDRIALSYPDYKVMHNEYILLYSEKIL